MHRDVRPMTLAYRKETMTFDMPGWYCDASEESIHTSTDLKVSDRMLNLLKARAERLLGPEEIRRIRKKLQLTQVRASEIIGSGPRAFQKYETGDLLPSKAISSALLLLDHSPEASPFSRGDRPVRRQQKARRTRKPANARHGPADTNVRKRRGGRSPRPIPRWTSLISM